MKGSLKNIGPNRWRMVYDGPRREDGSRKQVRSTIPHPCTKAEAERILRDAIRAVDSGEYVEDRALTVAGLFDRCFAAWEHRLAPTTMHRYRMLYRLQVKPQLGAIAVEQLRPLQVEKAYTRWRKSGRRDGRAENLSERTLLHLHRLLRRALAQGVRWNVVARNVADSVDAPAPRRSDTTALDETQVATFLAQAEKRSRYYAVLAFLVGTGARRGEAVALRWADVDFDRATVTIRRALAYDRVNGGLRFKAPKSGRSRTFTIPAFVVDVLRAHRVEQAKARLAIGAAYRDEGLVFATRDGSPIPPDRVSGAFDRLIRQLDLPRVLLHDLRHSNASLLGRAGVTLKVVSERLGHSTVGITGDLYSHVFEAHDREAASALDALLGVRRMTSANDPAAACDTIRDKADRQVAS